MNKNKLWCNCAHTQICNICHCCRCRCCCAPLCCRPPLPTGSFIVIKQDEVTLEGLPGAVFTLYIDGLSVASATSDAEGRLGFSDLRPGEYELVETTPPPGYQPSPQRFTVVIASDASVTVNGMPVPAGGFPIGNSREATPPTIISMSVVVNNERGVRTNAEIRANPLVGGNWNIFRRDLNYPDRYLYHVNCYVYIVYDDGTSVELLYIETVETEGNSPYQEYAFSHEIDGTPFTIIFTGRTINAANEFEVQKGSFRLI